MLVVRNLKVTNHLIFSSYCLAAAPARWLLQEIKGMLAQTLVKLASTILLLQWTEILSSQSMYKEAPLPIRLQTICSCQFCHTEINQEEVVEHMEICSGTDQEPEVQKLICPYCQQTFDIYEKIENHIGIHITR